MKHAFAWAAALCLTALTPIHTATAGEQKMTPDEQAVMAVIEHMTASFSAGNIPEVIDSYTPEAVVVMHPGQPVTGAAPLTAAFTEFAAIAPRFTYAGHEVVIAGDTAVHIAPWQMQGTDPAGNPVEGRGLSIAVLKRQADGGWKMVIDNPYGDLLLADQ